MKIKSLAFFSVVLFLVCSLVVIAQETSLIAIDGSVFYSDGTTLVLNGWNVNVMNKTQNLNQSSATGDAGNGRYSVTFLTFDPGAIVAATGDEIEVVVTDADGNEHSLTYILTAENIDESSTTIDVVTDVSVPPKTSSLLAIEGTVFLKDGVGLALDGLTVNVTNKTQNLSQSSATGDSGPGRYSVTFLTFDPEAIVAATGDEIEIVVTDAEGNKRASIIYQLTTAEVLENKANIDVVLDSTQNLTVNGTVYAEDGETPVPDGLTIKVANPSRELEVIGAIVEGKYSATLAAMKGKFAAASGEEIVVTVVDAEGNIVTIVDEEGNIIDSKIHLLTTAEVVANEVIIDVFTTYITSVSFNLALAPGLNMISIPLANSMATVDGSEQPVAIGKVGDLKILLGEDTSVYYYNTGEGKYEEASVEMDITGDIGLVAMLPSEEAVTITFEGGGWPGEINLVKGLNMFAVPLNANQTVGDLKTLLKDAPIHYYDTSEGKFKEAEAAMAIEGGVGYVTMLLDDISISVDGIPWEKEMPLAPSFIGGQYAFDPTSTPLMEVKGTVINENTGTVFDGLSVTVRHLSSDSVITDTTGSNANAGQFSTVFLNVFNNQSFRVGEVFKIDIQSNNGDIYFEPIQYTATQEDIKLGRIILSSLTARTIPKSSKLMQNWPNPFNPETWIPFQLSKAADVTVTIYDMHGRAVRQFDLGYTQAGIYNKRFNAIYWNGTNDAGERVSSGVYFYHIQAGEFSASRKMVILK